MESIVTNYEEEQYVLQNFVKLKDFMLVKIPSRKFLLQQM